MSGTWYRTCPYEARPRHDLQPAESSLALWPRPKRARPEPGSGRVRKRRVSAEGGEGAAYQRLHERDFPLRSRERGRLVERLDAVDSPRDRCDARERDSGLTADPRRGDADLRERPPLAVHRLEVGACLDLRQLDLEDELAVLERRRAPVALVRQPIELLDRELAPVRPQPGAERDERRRNVRGMRRGAEAVREDRVLAVLAVTGMAAVAAVQPAREVESPVPATGRLEEVAAERAHVPELRRRREPAGLAQRLGNRRLDLELRQRGPCTDRRALDPARHDPAHVGEPV